MASRRIVCGTKVCEHWVKPYAKELDSIKVRQLEFARMMCPWVNILQSKIKKATLTRPHVYNWSRILTGSLRCNCSYLFSPVSSIDTALITLYHHVHHYLCNHHRHYRHHHHNNRQCRIQRQDHQQHHPRLHHHHRHHEGHLRLHVRDAVQLLVQVLGTQVSVAAS